MATRAVRMLIEPQMVIEGAGVRLKRSIATQRLDYLDPFLLFDHFGSDNPRDYIAGFPLHPHRGIETVTYMLAGEVDHRDSLGNEGTIGAGDVQWMTSGHGIMHEEMPRPVNGQMEGFQLWVNLPARLKMSPPQYRGVSAADIPQVRKEDGTEVKIIAGNFEDVDGAVNEIVADPAYLDVSLPANSEFAYNVPVSHLAFAYLFRGSAHFGDPATLDVVHSTMLVVFDQGEKIVVTTAAEAARFLVVCGQPLHEPIARYGPFVMNTRAEIEQAIQDLNNGTFVR
ncbi:MAG: pirin family protein [Ignavibacteriales bacterium]|nr:pirin family protein [Ignavibacteriales bacterium]